jgi:hypothetical protein
MESREPQGGTVHPWGMPSTRLAMQKRPFCAHRVQPAVAMLASVEKPNAETSVQLGLDREVFRQRTDG